MIKNEYTLTVDIKKKHTAIVPTFVQNDAAILVFKILDNGKPFDLTGVDRVEVTHRRKDGQVVIGLASFETIKGESIIKYEYMGNEMSREGFVTTSVSLFSSDGAKVSIQPFKVSIVADIRDAIGATEEFGVLADLINDVTSSLDDVEEVKSETLAAAQEALAARDNTQAVIDDTSYIEEYNANTQYKKNNVVTFNGSSFIAKRNTKGNPPPTLPATSNADWGLVGRKGADGTGTVVVHRDEFVATANQKVFNLSKSYDQFQNRINVIVGGVPQSSPENFTETSPTSITFSEGVPAGVDVIVEYFSEAVPLATDAGTTIANHTNLLTQQEQRLSSTESELVSVNQQLAETATDLVERAVNVKQPPFNCKGDNLTDDTASFKSAIEYCLDNGVALYIPSGTYVLDSGKLYFDLKGRSLSMFGDGANSVIKRKSNSVTANWMNLFRFYTDNADVKKINLYNFSVDSNARENPLPEGSGGYAYEHCADFYLRGSVPNGKFIESLNVENINGYDPVADHFYLAGSTDANIKHANFNNVTFSGRTRERGDITITGLIGNCNISNFNGQLIEIEINDSGGLQAERMNLNINNVYASSRVKMTGSRVDAHLSNIRARNFTLSGRTLRLTMSNSTIYYHKDLSQYRFYYAENVTLNNVNFYFDVENGNVFRPLMIMNDGEFIFNSCSFKLNSSDPNLIADGFFIESTQTQPENRVVIIDNCTFDKRSTKNIKVDRCGRVDLLNNDYGSNGDGYAIHAFGSSDRPLNLLIRGVGFRNLNAPLIYAESGAGTFITFENVFMPIEKKGFKHASSNYTGLTTLGSQVFYTEGVANGMGFKGDRVIKTNPVIGEPCEWVATRTHNTDANWVVSRVFGVNVLKSPDGSTWKQSISDEGVVSWVKS